MVKRIGAGGMAEVLEAIAVGDHGFERRVAIKRMLPGETGEPPSLAAQRQFLDEARIAAQLHHANIVAITDYGIADGLPFQVLEHIDGIDVRGLIALAHHACRPRSRCTSPRWSARRSTTRTTRPAADGTPLGIVHRDVSPGNVLVSWSGDVKLDRLRHRVRAPSASTDATARTRARRPSCRPSRCSPARSIGAPICSRSAARCT